MSGGEAMLARAGGVEVAVPGMAHSAVICAGTSFDVTEISLAARHGDRERQPVVTRAPRSPWGGDG